jgi:chromosome segregation ATPase
LQNIEHDTTCTQVSILNEAELIKIVIEKHTIFIEEYTIELETLNEKITNNRSNYQHISKELDALETRINVLKEKRHQLYHQVKKLYLKLIEAINNSEQVSLINSEIEKLQNNLQKVNLSSDDEYGYIKRMQTLLNEMTGTVPDADVKQVIRSSIIDLLETARTARQELDEIERTPDKHKTEFENIIKEFEEIEPRQDWLNRRIKLHTEALKYWNERKSGVDKT